LEIQGKLVLDLGCGSGISTLKLLERNAGKVCAVDISEYMMDALKKKIEASGYSSNVVDLGAADAEKLPFDDSVLDVVISSMVLGMVPNQIKMIREMARVLKPRGIIAVVDSAENLQTHVMSSLFVPMSYSMPKLSQVQRADDIPIFSVINKNDPRLFMHITDLLAIHLDRR
jgi:demethylmenaquinone methyltransferase/2-methoxy-6-polyprenyl-1,4-benzoquinol methylase